MTHRRPVALFAVLLLAAAGRGQPPAPAPAVSPEEEKARKLFAEGKTDDALKELAAAVRANPALPPARLQLAGLFLQAGNAPAARANLELAAADDPKHPEVYLLNASLAFGERRLTDTVLSCQVALQLATTDPRWGGEKKKQDVRNARLGLAAAFEARRDWAAAREQMAALLADDPQNGPARVRLGSALFHLGKPDEALAELKKAHEHDPATDLPELVLHALYAGAGDTAKAEEWVKKARQAYPQNAKATRAYAGWLIDRGEPDTLAEAERVLDGLTKADADARESVALRGLIARHRRKFADAERPFERLVKEHPAETVYAWNLALVLAESADLSKQRRAIELAEAEVRKAPRSPEAYAVLGYCYYKAGRLDDADRALGTGAQLGPLTRDAAYFVGRLLADKQQPEKAAKVLDGALRATGPFLYRTEAAALLAEVERKLPKKDDKK
ncbi:MAG: tetratricopeptide repeat protein [Gemmataceae bacterium]